MASSFLADQIQEAPAFLVSGYLFIGCHRRYIT